MSLRFASIFDVKADESTLVLLLITHSFFVGMTRNLGSTVAITIFDPQYLPEALILSALINALIALALNLLQKRLSFLRMSVFNLGIQFFALLGFGFAFIFYDVRNPILALSFYVWIQVIMVLSYKEYWDLAGKLLDIRQSKRLFALIGIGEVLFIIPVGLAGGQIASLGIPMLIFLSAFGVIGSVLALATIRKRYGNLLGKPKRSRRERMRQQAQGRLKLWTYVILIMSLSVVYVLGFSLISQLYLDALKAAFPLASDAAAKSAFILVVLAVTGSLNLLMRLFGVDAFIAHFGVAGGLLALPILVLISNGGLVASYAWGLGSVFMLTVLVRGIYFVLKPSVDRPASQILFQVFPDSIRQRLLTIRDGIIEPVAAGVAGLLLYIFVPLGLNSYLQAIFLFVVVLLWLLVVCLVLRQYAASVIQVLQEREVNFFSELFQDRRTLEQLKRSLSSSKALEVMYALRVLDNLQEASLAESFETLLQNPSPMVRGETLRLIEKYHTRALLAPVARACEDDPDETVRALAVRTMAALGADESYETLMNYLADASSEIRSNAIIGLLRGGDIQGVINAGNALVKLAQSASSEEREEAAAILGEVGNQNFYRLLIELLSDEDNEVRNKALLAAGSVKHPRLWPVLINNLRASRTRSSAIIALNGADSRILPQFELCFAQTDSPPRLLTAIARICSRMTGDEVRVFLMKHATIHNLNVRSAILQALADLGYQAESEDERGLCMTYVRDEAAFVVWCMAAVASLQTYPLAEIVCNSLRTEIEQAKGRIFYWLSFLYDSELILHAKSQLSKATGHKWALILEALEQLLDSEVKAMILPLVERISPQEQLKRLSSIFPVDESADAVVYLDYIILAHGLWVEPWLRASALFAAPDIGGMALADAVHTVLNQEAGMVRETALWSLSRISPHLYNFYVQMRRAEAGELPLETVGVIKDTEGHMRKLKSGGTSMLLTIEKVLILKQVSIFATTSEEFLADLASLMEELRVEEAQDIIAEGTEPSYLYVVLEGTLLVKHGEHILAELGANEVFGEMSLFLDEKAHTATVTAKIVSHLLRLHKDDFLEILYDYPQISQGIIRELANRLRKSNARIVEMEQRLS
jgi:HEAT repeat protein